MTRIARYFVPHVFGMLGGIAFFWSVRWFTSLSGACRFFCNPPITVSLGVMAGLLGAQLYRNDHPVPHPDEQG